MVGLDIANKIDLTALVYLFPVDNGDDGKLHYYLLAKFWLRGGPHRKSNPAYAGWIKAGWLTATPGETTEFASIEAEILGACQRFDVKGLPYDPWSATQLAQRMMENQVPMVEYPMNVSTMSEPTKFFDASTRDGLIHHDGNPVLAWCVSNVVGHYDAKENVYPKKALLENKIDGAIAAIMVLGHQMLGGENVADDLQG